jgi:predicted nucleic acid-binding protein
MPTLFDTSVLVPALTDQLGNHAAALDAFTGIRMATTRGAVRLMPWQSAMRR